VTVFEEKHNPMNHAIYNFEHPPLPSADTTMQAFVEASARLQQTILEYCALALQDTLSEPDEIRLEAMLMQATDNSLLSFWLDEADYWVAHCCGDLDEATIAQQQEKLKRIIGQTWVDSLWSDLQNRTKALQAYLQRLGLYAGAIDGIMGPNTQLAMESLRRSYADDFPLEFTRG
jgi:hypothetical protein